MPVVKSNTPIETKPTIYEPKVEPKEHKSVVVDSKYTPLSNLITHVEGAQWKVNYYAQVLNRDSAVTGHNPNKAAPYQQYTYIQEYILKVSSPLSTTQDDETKVMQVTGSAVCYPPLVPNVGDMFVADIGDGRAGIFQVLLSEKKSIFKEAVYEINYALVEYASGERIKDLDTKVVKKLYFLMDFLEHGQNPLLSSEEWGLIRDLNKEYSYIAAKYVDRYYSHDYKTFIIPNQCSATYEPFVTRAIAHWLSSSIHPVLMYLKVYNVADDPYFEATSIYDAIEQRDKRSIEDCFKTVFNVSVKQFAFNPRIQSLRYSGMQSTLIPKDTDYAIDRERYRHQKRAALLQCSGGNCGGSEFQIPPRSKPIAILEDIPLIPDLDLNQTYVLSSDFYQDTPEGMSHLEIQLMNYFERESLNAKVILKLAFNWQEWTPLEQFYFTPILLILMKAAVRELK